MMLKQDQGAVVDRKHSHHPFSLQLDGAGRTRPKVDAFLKTLGDRHKADNATFGVVGRTDNVGDDQENVALGLGRAKSVAQILSGYGIAASRIKTDSKGKAEPVADNATDDGRHQNRRVVITVNR